MTLAARRFALIDRDGTINVDKHYLADPDLLELLPGAAAAIRRLNQAGWGVVVVTNQSGIARGKLDLAKLELIHAKFHALLAAEGAHVDAINICPHGPDDDCACRKPLPGLVDAARAQFGFDPAQAVVIGDKEADVELGLGVGATAILVRTGYGRTFEATTRATHIADDLSAAVDIVLANQ